MPEGRGVEFATVQPACAALASLAKCRLSFFSLFSAAILALSASAAILAALSAAILAALSAAFSEDDINFVEMCYKWY